MLNYQNKIFTKLISLMLIQVFLFTCAAYPETIYDKNKTLRVPLDSPNGYKRMQETLGTVVDGRFLKENKGWQSRLEYAKWMQDARNKILELRGAAIDVKVYYYAIGGGFSGPSSGVEDIDIVSPLKTTDFTELIGADVTQGDFEIFKRRIKKDLSSLREIDLEGISFGRGIENIGSISYPVFTASFSYLGKLRKVKVYYKLDATQIYPDELKNGYNILYSRGNPGLIRKMSEAVKSGLINNLFKNSSFIVMENLPNSDLSFEGFNKISLGDVSWAGVRKLDFYTNISKNTAGPALASNASLLTKELKRVTLEDYRLLEGADASQSKVYSSRDNKYILKIFTIKGVRDDHVKELYRIITDLKEPLKKEYKGRVKLIIPELVEIEGGRLGLLSSKVNGSNMQIIIDTMAQEFFFDTASTGDREALRLQNEAFAFLRFVDEKTGGMADRRSSVFAREIESFDNFMVPSSVLDRDKKIRPEYYGSAPIMNIDPINMGSVMERMAREAILENLQPPITDQIAQLEKIFMDAIRDWKAFYSVEKNLLNTYGKIPGDSKKILYEMGKVLLEKGVIRFNIDGTWSPNVIVLLQNEKSSKWEDKLTINFKDLAVADKAYLLLAKKDKRPIITLQHILNELFVSRVWEQNNNSGLPLYESESRSAKQTLASNASLPTNAAEEEIKSAKKAAIDLRADSQIKESMTKIRDGLSQHPLDTSIIYNEIDPLIQQIYYISNKSKILKETLTRKQGPINLIEPLEKIRWALGHINGIEIKSSYLDPGDSRSEELYKAKEIAEEKFLDLINAQLNRFELIIDITVELFKHVEPFYSENERIEVTVMEDLTKNLVSALGTIKKIDQSSPDFSAIVNNINVLMKNMHDVTSENYALRATLAPELELELEAPSLASLIAPLAAIRLKVEQIIALEVLPPVSLKVDLSRKIKKDKLLAEIHVQIERIEIITGTVKELLSYIKQVQRKETLLPGADKALRGAI